MSQESWPAEESWQNALSGLRNTVRQELVTRQLEHHLPSSNESIAVLDVGCGQGTQIIDLARKGYSVTGLDPSKELLSLAQDRLSTETPEVQERVELVSGSIDNLSEVLPKQFDVVLCHGVIMYLPSLDKSLEDLSVAVAPGGLLSVVTRNRFSIAMRQGMKGNYREVVDSINAQHYTNGLGVENVRGDEPEEIINILSGLGFTALQWYGVRLFSDHLDDKKIPDNLDELIDAEELIGSRDPYKQLCALIHVIGRKS